MQYLNNDSTDHKIWHDAAHCPNELYCTSPYNTLTIGVIKPQKLEKQNWLQFLLVLKVTALKQQILNFCPQILSTEASFYICDRLVTNINAIVSAWALNLQITF